MYKLRLLLQGKRSSQTPSQRPLGQRIVNQRHPQLPKLLLRKITETINAGLFALRLKNPHLKDHAGGSDFGVCLPLLHLALAINPVCPFTTVSRLVLLHES